MKQATLSEEMISTKFEDSIDGYFRIDKVKQSIKELKERMIKCGDSNEEKLREINEWAGKDLI